MDDRQCIGIGQQDTASSISVWDLAMLSDEQLEAKYHISTSRIAALKTATVPVPLKVDQVKPTALSTGVAKFDELLGGGVFTRRLSEICGQSATGKTTLCLSIALAAQKTDKRSICFISSEPLLIFRRLEHLQPQFPHCTPSKIYTLPKAVYTTDAFLGVLYGEELKALFNRGLSVLIIDTLPKLDVDEVLAVTTFLRNAAFKHNTAIVLTNGITNAPQDDEPSTYMEGVLWSQERPRIMGGTSSPFEWAAMPKLGWTLARSVDTRVLLTRNDNKRHMQILFSADTMEASTSFQITGQGLA